MRARAAPLYRRAEAWLRAVEVSEPVVQLWAVVVAVVVVVVGINARFDYELPVPMLPPKPAPVEAAGFDGLDNRPAVYAGHLESDSLALEVTPSASSESMAAKFDYAMRDERQLLVIGQPVVTPWLRITPRVDKPFGATEPHFILRIENLAKVPLAYRIVTSTSDACEGKRNNRHNALAIPVHGAPERTECPYREKLAVYLESIETIALPALSYHYVSRLRPSDVGIDARIGGGHTGADKPLCTTVPQRVNDGIVSKELEWHDVIDFYARHSCERYTFPIAYKAFKQDGEHRLPVTHASLKAEAAAAVGP